MDIVSNNLYSILLDYKKNTFVYQVLAKDEKEAQFKWIREIDLNKLGVLSNQTIKDDLIFEIIELNDYPGLLDKLQSVWCSSVTNFGEKDLAIANIVNTISIKKGSQSSVKVDDPMLQFSKQKNLYTVQLDYKGGTYVSQVFAFNQIEAQIEWIKQLNFNVIAGIPKNIEEIRNNILLQKMNLVFLHKN